MSVTEQWIRYLFTKTSLIRIPTELEESLIDMATNKGLVAEVHGEITGGFLDIHARRIPRTE